MATPGSFSNANVGGDERAQVAQTSTAGAGSVDNASGLLEIAPNMPAQGKTGIDRLRGTSGIAGTGMADQARPSEVETAAQTSGAESGAPAPVAASISQGDDVAVDAGNQAADMPGDNVGGRTIGEEETATNSSDEPTTVVVHGSVMEGMDNATQQQGEQSVSAPVCVCICGCVCLCVCL